MALNIRNQEAEKLAAALARLTGETKTEAVTRALGDRLARVRREDRRRDPRLRRERRPPLMVIDTPARLAILQDEPERRSFNEAIEAAERR